MKAPLAIAEIELELKSLRRIHARQAHQPGYLHHAFHQTLDITCVHHAQGRHGHQAIERATGDRCDQVSVQVPAGARSSERAVRGAANSQSGQCRERPDAARDRAAQLIVVQVPTRVVVGARSARGRELTGNAMP